MTAQQLTLALKQWSGTTVQYGFAFPYVQMSVTRPEFSEISDDAREALVAQYLAISISKLRSIGNSALLTFHWLAPGEPNSVVNRGDHWIFGRLREAAPVREVKGPTSLHFFGYKGGQARSTVLAVLGRTLAESGLKVLMIDADLEAPSLPDIWGKRPLRNASTLLGLYLDPEARPLPLPCVAINGQSDGRADLIAARLLDDGNDWEYDAFTLKALLDPAVSRTLGDRLRRFASDSKYDVILIDQRTGASPATLNWFQALPGGYCIFARLDNQWKGGARFYRTLADTAPTTAGAIVSYKPDEENSETFRNRNAQQINELNYILEEAVFSKMSVEDREPSSENWVTDIDRWVMWPYDQIFRITRLPSSEDLGHSTMEAINRLRTLLELPIAAERLKLQGTRSNLTGAASSNDLIYTSALKDLRTVDNPYIYIFGRKGTGKSTLFRALADEELGIPLVADDEFRGDIGLRSADLREINIFSDGPELLWWKLLLSANTLGTPWRTLLRGATASSSTDSPKEHLRQRLSGEMRRRTFLIDGLETAFPSASIHEHVGGLFEVMRALQSDADFREKLELKLFLRADLARSGVQNLEQQINGRYLQLSWDLQGILNFMLSRVALPQLTFFASSFPRVIEDINVLSPYIKEGKASTEQAFELLLQIFPDRITGVNAKMRTFLQLHFADSVSGEERYYPRFVQHFLDAIDSAGNPNTSETPFRDKKLTLDGRISSPLVEYAHSEASKKFLAQVRQELEYLLSLPPDQIEKLLGGFAGKQTPFNLIEMIRNLSIRLKISEENIRTIMESMKSLGIFEERPGYELDEWRSGRLFKAALRMKLRR